MLEKRKQGFIMQRKIIVKELWVLFSLTATDLEGQKVAQNCPGDLF